MKVTLTEIKRKSMLSLISASFGGKNESYSV